MTVAAKPGPCRAASTAAPVARRSRPAGYADAADNHCGRRHPHPRRVRPNPAAKISGPTALAASGCAAPAQPPGQVPFESPNTAIPAGTRTARTTVASSRIAADRPNTNSWTPTTDVAAPAVGRMRASPAVPTSSRNGRAGGSHGSASAHARSRERCSSRCCCYQRSCGSSQASVQAPEAPRQPPVRTSAHTGSANAARGRRLEPSGPVVTVPNPVTVKQRTILAALRDAQHANDSQPVGTFAVARWCPEPWTCRVEVVAAALLALQAHGQAVCVSELGGRTWRLTEAGRRQLVPRRGPAPARDRRTTAR
jgi:hypothetical protein